MSAGLEVFRDTNYYLQVYAEAMGSIRDNLPGIKAAGKMPTESSATIPAREVDPGLSAMCFFSVCTAPCVFRLPLLGDEEGSLAMLRWQQESGIQGDLTLTLAGLRERKPQGTEGGVAVQAREGGPAEPPGLWETVGLQWSGFGGRVGRGCGHASPLFAQELISQFSPLVSLAVCISRLVSLAHTRLPSHTDFLQGRICMSLTLTL